MKAVLDSRLLTRALIVSGILGLVFASQVERATKTAYSSEWVARGTRLRVPTEAWEWAFPAAGFVSVMLLLCAALLWRRRENNDQRKRAVRLRLLLRRQPPPAAWWPLAGLFAQSSARALSPALRVTSALSLLTLGFSLATAWARWYAADGRGEGALTVATVFNLLSLACVAAVALTTGNLVYEHLGGLKRVFRGVLQRQRMNLLVVFALTVALLFIGDTSGQSVDSIRSWSPLVLGAEDPWSGIGAARLLLGLAAALVFAVALYESGTRLNRVTLEMHPPKQGLLLATGVATTVVGLLAFVPSSALGPGLLTGGVILLLIRALDLPKLKATDADRSDTDEADHGPLLTRAEMNAPEWIAITPLLALAGISMTATVEAMLSAGAGDGNAWLTLLPAGVLGVLATLMTRRRPTTPRGLGLRACTLVGAGVVGLSLVFLALALSLFADVAEWWMAGYGAAWFVVLTVYTIGVFHRDPRETRDIPELEDRPETEDTSPMSGRRARTMPIVLGPVALGGGLAVFIALHVRPLDAGNLLGVFTLAFVALAFALPFLHLAVRTTMRLRPPTLLSWFGFTQLPVLTLLLLWWIAVGVAQTHWGRMATLHDARLVQRSEIGLDTQTAGKPASELEQYFDQWLAAQPDKAGEITDDPIPLVLVAAHGGGIRAAYWTVAALDCVIAFSGDGVTEADLRSGDEAVRTKARGQVCGGRRRAQAEQQRAAKRIFMASGVSGGAVGLYAYARQLLQEGWLGESAEEAGGVDWIDERLGGDFASPAVGWALFHDLPNRVLGLHPDPGAPCGWKLPGMRSCLKQDRAAVLEDTFDAAWKNADSSRAQLRRAYDLRFAEDANVRGNAALVPLLVMNATLTGGKARAVVSAADIGSWPGADADAPERGDDRFPLAGTVEVRDALCESQDMRLSTAALLAARFPYVTPSGRIAGRCGYEGDLRRADMPDEVRCAHEQEQHLSCEGHYVDGGYTDNSGLFSIVAVWPSLRELIVQHNLDAARLGQRQIAPMIVELDNHYQRSIQASVPSGGSAAETLIPPQTAFGGRSAIETYARAAAYRILRDSCTVTISPALHPGLIAPLGWELSQPARMDLRAGLTKPHPADTTGMRTTRILREVQFRLTAAPKANETIGPDFSNCLPLSVLPAGGHDPTVPSASPRRLRRN